MAGGTWSRISPFGLLSYFLLFSFIYMTTSVSLDLTELQNKVAKIKLNPRGNLWATGHFMGKKNIMDSSLLDSSDEPGMNAIRAAPYPDRNSQKLVYQNLLRISAQDLQKLHSNDQEVGLLMKILDNIRYSRKRCGPK